MSETVDNPQNTSGSTSQITDEAALLWGKCKVVIDGGVTDAEILIDDIQENTTQLSTEQGAKKEAILEGGEILATRYQRNKYTLEFTEFGDASITHDDGIVAGRHSVKVICTDSGEDETVFKFPSSVINVQSIFSSEYGVMTKYTCVACRQSGGTILWGIDAD